MNLLPIEHGFNFRDLGGYHTTTGLTIKPHRLIRAGKLNRLTPSDQDLLNDYGVRLDIDFRSAEEFEAEPDRVPSQAEYRSLPVFETDQTQVSRSWKEQQQDFANGRLAGFHHMEQTYQRMVATDTARQAYHDFFAALLAQSDGGVLFHCTAGKDRTGLAAVFLLNALGVDQATIRQDYLATNDYLAPVVEHVVAQAKAAGANDNLQTGLRDIWLAKDAYLDRALQTVASEYGTMAEFLTAGLRLSTADLKTLQAMYLA